MSDLNLLKSQKRLIEQILENTEAGPVFDMHFDRLVAVEEEIENWQEPENPVLDNPEFLAHRQLIQIVFEKCDEIDRAAGLR